MSRVNDTIEHSASKASTFLSVVSAAILPNLCCYIPRLVAKSNSKVDLEAMSGSGGCGGTVTERWFTLSA